MSYESGWVEWTIPTFDGQTHDLTAYSLYRFNHRKEGNEQVSFRRNTDMSFMVWGDSYLLHAYRSDFHNGLIGVTLTVDKHNMLFNPPTQENRETVHTLVVWIREHCSEIVYRYKNYFYFKNEQDAMMFRLRWA